MEDIFITKIKVEKSRNLENVTIPLSETERKHLILTGRNGSGKTSLLNILEIVLDPQRTSWSPNQNFLSTFGAPKNKKNKDDQKLDLYFSENLNKFFDSLRNISFPIINFRALRNNKIKKSDKIEKIFVHQDYRPTEEIYSDKFLQFLVNQKVDRSFAKDDGENEIVEQIDTWFNNFENQLKKIFETDELQLKFKRKDYSFDILIPGREPFGFEVLSDGYSSIIGMIGELIMRMEKFRKNMNVYDTQGIVLIDEVESHLHISLQKIILPFLIDFFPKIQFIVSTHSPFVLSSISNAVIFDLENKTVIEDLSQYSYDAIIESYFDSDKYSEEIKGKIEAYDQLSLIENKTPEQIHQFRQLKDYFDNVPTYKAPELKAKLLEIDLRSIKPKTTVD